MPLEQLARELEKLERMFDVNTQKLKEISRRFGEELDEGLSDA